MLMIDSLLIVTLLVSCYTDVRKRMIYNAVLLPAAVLALGWHIIFQGWGGVVFALQGAVLGFALLFIPYALGGMGAGDVKLLSLVGLFKGPGFVFYGFLLTALAGGALSLFLLLQRKLGSWRKDKMFAEAEKKDSFPYGAAIMIGTVLTYVVM